MSHLNLISRTGALTAAVAVALLAGCTSNPEPAPAPAPAAMTAPQPAPAPVAAAPVTPPAPAIDLTADPVVVPFEQESTDLPMAITDVEAELVERARNASRVTLTGYADRKLPGVSRNIAMARANAVRNQLVKAGVPANRFAVKVVTSVPEKHAVEISFTERKARR